MTNLPLALSVLAIVSAVSAQHSDSDPLTKPSLEQNLDYLKADLAEALPFTAYTLELWDYGTIPELCKKIVTGDADDGETNFDPHDFEIWNIQYDDCGDPWVFCHHKDSNVTIESMADQFGQVPVQMRQWVRHVIDVPDSGSHAFEDEGALTIFGPTEDMLTILIHETGHSLDTNGAYADNPLSSSDNWWNAYDKDSYVPDDYAKSNALEDVAQNTVVAVFNENVNGGFPAVEPNWNDIFNQYQTIIDAGDAAGVGNSILVPGQSGDCVQHLKASKPVSMDDDSTSKRSTKRRSNKSTSGCTLTF